jgi:hypothetical protein
VLGEQLISNEEERDDWADRQQAHLHSYDSSDWQTVPGGGRMRSIK